MWIKLVQLGGWGILVAYLVHTPFSFDPFWVFAYVAISVAAGGVYVLGVTAQHEALHTNLPHEKNASVLENFRRRPMSVVFLAPGETGFFFVPVAIVGVTWW